uniref:Uncharacterized protein n=1 Tax=Caenorhabditis tropicalis TaxID=1561998 RepID=A0A1I7U2V5_9PELO
MRGVEVQLRHEERWVKQDEKLYSNEENRNWRCTSFDEKTGRPVYLRLEGGGDSVQSITEGSKRIEKEYLSPKQEEVNHRQTDQWESHYNFLKSGG